jgi:hypothetical protein
VLASIWLQVGEAPPAMPRCVLCERRLAALGGARKIQALLFDKVMSTIYVEGVCVRCVPNLVRFGHTLPLPLMDRARLDNHLLQLAIDMRNFGWSWDMRDVPPIVREA